MDNVVWEELQTNDVNAQDKQIDQPSMPVDSFTVPFEISTVMLITERARRKGVSPEVWIADRIEKYLKEFI